MPSAKRPAKVQRWMDVIAAFLRFRFPISFEQLAAEVPAYADPDQADDARMRMFERDKDELRELGVPIETVAGEEGGFSSYRLKSRAFYLPYLMTADDGAAAAPPIRPKGPGYQDLPILSFEPDEIAMIARAATRVQHMQHAMLAADAATAVRKLAFDIPLAIDGDSAREVILQPSHASDHDVLELLDTAVRRRKLVDFDYRSMDRDAHSRRGVQPYGLIFLSGIWYLVAHDVTANALRHFRVSRMSRVVINSAKAQSHDFEIPSDFDLWSHTLSRQAWEMGDADATHVSVRFDPSNRFAAAGAELGDADPEHSDCRRFVVRRPDAFVRWLLSFGGSAVPVAPSTIVDALHEVASNTVALYLAATQEHST